MEDVVAQLQQDVLAKLPRRHCAVAGEDQALDPHLRAFLDAEDHFLGAVAREHLPFRHLCAQEACADVEAAQPARHLLGGLGVEGLLRVERGREGRGEHCVGKRPVPTQLESQQRTCRERDDHAGVAHPELLDPRRIDARPQPPCPPIPLADAADRLVEGDEVQHVAPVQSEGGGQLIAVEPEVALETNLGDPRGRSFLDAQLERDSTGRRLSHRRHLRVAVPDPEICRPDDFACRAHLVRLELRIDLEVRVLQEEALGQRTVPGKRHRGESLDRGEHEDDADPPIAHRLCISCYPGKPGAGVERADRVAHVARVERLAGVQSHQRAHGLGVRALVGDLSHARGLRHRALREQEREERGEHYSPSHLKCRSIPKSVPVPLMTCSLSSWSRVDSASESW